MNKSDDSQNERNAKRPSARRAGKHAGRTAASEDAPHAETTDVEPTLELSAVAQSPVAPPTSTPAVNRVRASRASSVPPAPTPIQPEPSSEPVHVVRHSEPVEPGLARTAHAHLAEPLEPYDASELGDDFGLDADYETQLRPWLERFCRDYLHVEVRGAQHVPAQGRALLIANHSRALTWDGILLRTALRMHHESARTARWLVDDAQFHAPFLGTFVNRLGAVRANQENAERLLRREELLTVFPEGFNAADRRYEDRHRLMRFGRGGYVKLALRTGTPVIPVAIVHLGAEQPLWRKRVGGATRLLGGSLLGLGPLWTRVGMMSVPPLSGHIRIHIGAPVRELARQDAHATRDDGLIHELNECVRGAVQGLVNATLKS